MRQHEIIKEAIVPIISPQQARDMFGPMYHGTNQNLADIISTGFNAKYSVPSSKLLGFSDTPVGPSHGYSLSGYGFTGISAPIHHLGFGSYFTTVKSIAKAFSGGSMAGQRAFYLDSDRICKINFGSANTMMKWWRENGYDMTAEETRNRDIKAWIRATGNLTRKLRKDYDAVWFLGKSIHRLLDGDQVCVYNTKLISVVYPKLATGLEIGAQVTHTQEIPSRYRGSNVFYIDNLKPDDYGSAGKLPGWKGVFRADTEESDRKIGRHPIHFIPPSNMIGIIKDIRDNMYDIKWQKGGVRYNYRPEEIKPYKKG